MMAKPATDGAVNEHSLRPRIVALSIHHYLQARQARWSLERSAIGRSPVWNYSILMSMPMRVYTQW